MKKNLFALLLIALTIALPAVGTRAEAVGEAWRVSLGGRLYDNYWLETRTQPVETRNPLYPAGLKTLPADSWRCVSCHGWDYRGRDGHLKQLSASKVFVSLRLIADQPPADIAVAIRSGSHRKFTQAMSAEQIEALALFLSVGQHDAAEILGNNLASGAPLRGKDIFEGACISCHQADGKAYIEGESGDKPALGWVVQNRPEQALHKIRNGVPGADMLSLRFLEQNRLADLIAYLRTLDPTTE